MVTTWKTYKYISNAQKKWANNVSIASFFRSQMSTAVIKNHVTACPFIFSNKVHDNSYLVPLFIVIQVPFVLPGPFFDRIWEFGEELGGAFKSCAIISASIQGDGITGQAADHPNFSDVKRIVRKKSKQDLCWIHCTTQMSNAIGSSASTQSPVG